MDLQHSVFKVFTYDKKSMGLKKITRISIYICT